MEKRPFYNLPISSPCNFYLFKKGSHHVEEATLVILVPYFLIMNYGKIKDLKESMYSVCEAKPLVPL